MSEIIKNGDAHYPFMYSQWTSGGKPRTISAFGAEWTVVKDNDDVNFIRNADPLPLDNYSSTSWPSTS